MSCNEMASGTCMSRDNHVESYGGGADVVVLRGGDAHVWDAARVSSTDSDDLRGEG